jgi:hypothetical protein
MKSQTLHLYNFPAVVLAVPARATQNKCDPSSASVVQGFEAGDCVIASHLLFFFFFSTGA